METPLISVIIPNYNHSAFLVERLESLINQTYQNIEIIILDDCSTDNSKEIIRKYSNCSKVKSIILNEKNSGSPFLQWEKGINLSSGEWIWIAESDDVADVQFLEKMVSLINESISIIYCKSTIINENGDSYSNNIEWLNDLSSDRWNLSFQAKGIDLLFDYFIYKNIVSNASSAIFRKLSTTNIKYSVTEYKTCGDWLFFAQIFLTGDVYYVSESLNYWRQHQYTTRNNRSLSYEFLRINEIRNVINVFGLLAKEYNYHIDYKKYKWLETWWLGRFTYKNIFKKQYFFVPLPKENKPSFYYHLIIRIFVEVIKSIVSKLKL